MRNHSRLTAPGLAVLLVCPLFADTVPLTGDAYYLAGNAANFGGATTINVGGAGPAEGLVLFDLSALPAGTTAASVAKATLRLFVNKIGTPGSIDINAASGAWSEGTVNSTNAPAAGASVASALPVTTASVYTVIDATAIVKQWIGGAPLNNGFLISADRFPGTSVFFDSKESVSTSHPPTLEIALVSGLPGPQGPAGGQGPIGPQGPVGPQGATGPAGTITLPFSGFVNAPQGAFVVTNTGSTNAGSGGTAQPCFSAAISGRGSGLVAPNSPTGGSGYIGCIPSASGPGEGAFFLGGQSTSQGSGSGTGAVAFGGNGVVFGSVGGAGIAGVGGNSSSEFGGVGGFFQAGTGLTGSLDAVFAMGSSQLNGIVTVNGDMIVNGTLSKSAGSFKIDHPLDPANKYLYHSFVESPDMMNIYNGIATLDGDGAIWITMPDWFEALNQDFRYQLTSIGAPGPNLYIAETMRNNRLRIAGGAPGSRVSWQVTGIRHDAYAEVHRIPVEQAKTGEEQGHYLHPEAFAQPKEKQVGYERIERTRRTYRYRPGDEKKP